MTDHRDIDELSGVATTGHSWDGIKELNNPLPRWWLWTFYATIVFSIAYVVVYPAIPLVNSATQGTFGWSSRADLRQDVAAVDASRSALRDQIKTLPIGDVMKDQKLRAFAVSAGASLFKVNCTQCHGSGAQGGPGFPNLNDDSWIWGGTPDQILTTITHGVRDQTSPETRIAEMPAFGRDQLLTPEQVGAVAEHVMSIAGLQHDATQAAEGAKAFAENCAACHGEKGEGNAELGAPQLSDALWLYGGTREQILSQIKTPRHGMMPAWQPRLGETAVKELAVYVHSLGGGK